MAKRKRKKKVAPTPEPEVVIESKPSAVSRAVTHFFRPRVLLLMALTIFGVVMSSRINAFLPDLAKRAEYQITIENIRVASQPHWIPHDLVQQAARSYGLPAKMSVLDDNVTEEIGKAFLYHPWVTGVQVRIDGPQQVTVEPTYRVPVAMVRMRSGGMYPIDADGVLLPPADFRQADTWRYPVIQGVRSTPQGPAGTEWGDICVSTGASLANALLEHADDGQPYWRKLHLKAIIAPKRTAANMTADDLMFELATLDGSRIVWGRAPGTKYPGEVDTAKKLSRLEVYLERFENFDQPNGPYQIDVYHLVDDIIRRPLRR